MNSVPISILIATKNCAQQLERTLKSLLWAEQIMIVDSHSSDGTLALAQRYGATVIQFTPDGPWPKKRNWALAQENLWKRDWVFIVDSDEVLPPEAPHALRAIVTEKNPPYAGYTVGARYWFLEGWLGHAYRSNVQTRLFLRSKGRYEKLIAFCDDHTDMEIHEHVVVAGPTSQLPFRLDHYAYPDVFTFIAKHNRYSDWEARMQRCGAWERSDGALPISVQWKRKLRRWAKHLPFRPTLRFLYTYLIDCAFLDGLRGYYFARLLEQYELMTVIKEYELELAQLDSRSRTPR